MAALPRTIWCFIVLIWGLQVIAAADSSAQPQNIHNSWRPGGTSLSQRQWMKTIRAEGLDARHATASFPPPSHQSIIKPLLPSLSIARLRTDLDKLTSFNNRYYKSPDGQRASDWLLSQVRNVISGHEPLSAITFAHAWPQSSIIVRWRSRTSGPVTILSAHLDSINMKNPAGGRAPGADAGGSGAIAILEVLRMLVNSNYQPNTPLEFHWYAAEEVGLLGSNAVATTYRRDSVPVKSVLNLDAVGFFKPGSREVISLLADNVDPGLNTFMQQLVTAYSRIPPFMDKACGYACGSHASWYKKGYSTAFLYEAPLGVSDNPYVLSADDRTSVQGFSYEHWLEFAKVALAYVVEMSA